MSVSGGKNGLYDKLGPAGRATLAALGDSYDLDSPAAYNIALLFAVQADDIEKANNIVTAEGVVAYGGKNGAPYAHPAVGVRNKAIQLQLDLAEKLQQYVKRVDDELGDLPT